MYNIKSKIRLLFFLPLILIGGCQYRYEYKYENLEARAVSFRTDESKVRPHCIFSIPSASIPELMVMLDGKEIYLNSSLTRNEVLNFIKRTKIRHRFASLDWDTLENPSSMDKIYITLRFKDGYVQLLFSEQILIKWSIGNGEEEGLKIASPKNKKYYSMPITVLEMKEIFGNPKKVIKDINWK